MKRILILSVLMLAVAIFVFAGHTNFDNIVTDKSVLDDSLKGANVVMTGNMSVAGTGAIVGALTQTGAITCGSNITADGYITATSYGSFTGGVRTDSTIKLGSGALWRSYYPPVMMMFHNKSGSKIEMFSPVGPDSAAQSIVAMVKVDDGTDTLTEALEIGSDGGYWRITAAGFSLADAGSLVINGTAALGPTWGAPVPTFATRAETLALTATDTYYTSVYQYWTDLDTLITFGTETNDSVVVLAYPFMAITEAGDNATMLYGVTRDSIVDNDSGYVVIAGAALCAIDATDAVPGVNLQSAGSGECDAVGSVTAGASLGHALEASCLADTIWIFVDHK